MANPFDEDSMMDHRLDDRKGSHAFTSEVLPENISYSVIASKLIADNYLLTALELHTELIEAGREVTKLKEFFSNPGNFEQQAAASRLDVSSSIRRSSSQATLDSLDFARYSEDGERGTDERVAVLEFELRKAKETISALRTNLTVAAESESTTPDQGSTKGGTIKNDTIKPHEQRALNFLLNEYLLLHNYKLTSITFADENEDQDFEDWDDVGLNIPKPAELLNVYRDFLRQTGHSRSSCQNVTCQTDPPVELEPIQPLEVQSTETLAESTDHPTETSDIELKTEPERNVESNVELLEQIERLKEQVVSVEQEKQELRRLWTAERLQDLSVTTPGSELGTALLGNESASMHSATPERFELIEAEGKATDEADGNVSLADTDTEWMRVRLPNANVGQEPLACTDGSSSSTDRSTAAPVLPEGPSTRALPAAFQQQVFARCFISTARHQEKHGLDEMLRQEINADGLVHILGQSLPRIIPNVILNKREEVLALLVATVHLHPSPAERDRLLHLLFNLKKRPQEDDRLMILAGVVTIARCSGLGLVENEVLPQCWEQIAHRHVERRLLVAEACSALAPYISSPIRNSLMLSMLQQMLLEDKSDQVREMVVRSLALIITFIDDKDKYFQCEQLAMTALDDPSPDVVASTTNYLLPVLAKWSLDLERLHVQLFSRLLDKLKANILDKYVKAMEKLLPYLVISVICCENVTRTITDETPTFEYQLGEGLTNPSVFYDGETPVGLVMGAFDCYVDQEYYEEWTELEWVFSTFLPSLLDAVQQVEAANEPVVVAMVSLFRSVCTGFGSVVTRTKVRPQFTVRLQNLEKNLASGRTGNEAAMPSLAIIPVYIVGVLASGQPNDTDELTSTLKRFLFGLPLCGCPLNALASAIRGLCAGPGHQDAVTAALWDAVVHPRPVVRLAAAELAVDVVACVGEAALNAKVVPALITLASDTDIAVRTASVAAFGALITSTSSKEAQDKTYMQLQSFLADPVTRDSHGMLLQLVATMGAIVAAAEPWFREEVILPQLAAMAAYTMQMSNLTKRLDLANVLVEAFSCAVYCTLSKQSISTALLPGLRYLEPICATSLRNHLDTVLTMIRSAESRIEPQRQPERSNSLANATANVGQGMEDMKKRVSNIFTVKPNISRPTNLPNLQGIFRKK